MRREPFLRSRLASARAKRTRFASSKAFRRSSEVLSGARLNIGDELYHRNTDCPRDLINRPQGYRLYRRSRQAAAQDNLASARVYDEPWDGINERQRVGPSLFGRQRVPDHALVGQLHEQGLLRQRGATGRYHLRDRRRPGAELESAVLHVRAREVELHRRDSPITTQSLANPRKLPNSVS